MTGTRRARLDAAVVGSASVIHPVDWRLEQPDPLPSLDQLDGFVADYEAARGAPFDDDERVVLPPPGSDESPATAPVASNSVPSGLRGAPRRKRVC